MSQSEPWFAWRPVRAAVLPDDAAGPAHFTWDGRPCQRVLWLVTVRRERRERGWRYEFRARPETPDEFALRQW